MVRKSGSEHSRQQKGEQTSIKPTKANFETLGQRFRHLEVEDDLKLYSMCCDRTT